MIQGRDVSGQITVRAPNVTIRDVRVRSSSTYGIRIENDVRGTIIEHVEIDCLGSSADSGVSGHYFALRYANIHSCTDGVKIGIGSTVEASFIHDLRSSRADPHQDGIQMMRGTGAVIRGNRILRPNQGTSTIIIKSDNGSIDNVLIENNYLNGGGYTIYSRAGSHGNPTNVRIRGNTFGRDYRWALLSADGSVSWTANVWADTGAPAP